MRILDLVPGRLVAWWTWPWPLRVLSAGFILLLTALFFFVGFPPISDSKQFSNDPFLKFVPLQDEGQYDATTEQAMLFDSAPIFIPTPWNAAQQNDRFKALATPAVFDDFEPQINVLAEMSAGAALEPKSGSVDSPVDLLGAAFEDLFLGFGKSAESMEAFPDPASAVYYRGMETAWKKLPVFPQFESVPALTNPVTFYLNIAKSRRLLGSPMLATGSGMADFDRAARTWLISPEILAQFPVGYSEVVVYP